jgi:uncharacterized membrane protein YoaK (UPF0700 family)
MGIQNATMRRAGGVNIGLTYVTGTLVQIGRAMGGEGGMPRVWRYLAQWLSLVAGAVLGSFALSISTLAALSAAAAAAGSLAITIAFARR